MNIKNKKLYTLWVYKSNSKSATKLKKNTRLKFKMIPYSIIVPDFFWKNYF